MKLGLNEAQDRIKIAGTNINNLRYVCDTTLMIKCKEKLKSLLMKVKEDREISGLRLTLKKKWRSWHLVPSLYSKRWETIGTVTDFIFLGSKITVDSDCSHGIKRCLFLGRKPMTKLDSILKSRDITLPTNVRFVKVMVFPVVIYGCESWTVKKAKPRTDALELWCCRTLLRVPGTARRSSLSILKEINNEYPL